jgi:putative phosphoribosyl transferase
MGAIAEGGVRVLNQSVIRAFGISNEVIDDAVERERAELTRREQLYRGGYAPFRLEGRMAILVDDGLATGASMRAAARAARMKRPRRTVIAVPVAAASTVDDLRNEADEVVCVDTPEPFYAVGMWYQDFRQTTDEEVRELLQRNWSERRLVA